MRYRRKARTPLTALALGLAAGALGSLAQNVFFAVTRKVAPESLRATFSPADPEQQDEMPTQTVARRFVEGMARRKLANKDRAAQIVHVAFGASWGGLYGLAFESSRMARGPLGAMAFSTLVWGIGDNLLLPAFRLAAPPAAYPPKTHGYALAAHLVYGGAVWAGYGLLRPAPWRVLKALLALGGTAMAARKLPRPLRPIAYRALVKGPMLAARTARRVNGAIG